MKKLHDIRVAVRLPIVPIVALLALIVFAFVAFDTLNTIRVGGPMESHLTTDNQVLADIAPPMANLTNTDFWMNEYYTALGEGDAEGAADARRRVEEAIRAFRATHEQWASDGLHQSSIADGLAQVRSTGEAYLTLLEQDVLPKLDAGDLAGAQQADTALMQAYDAHEAAVVDQTRILNADIAEESTNADQLTQSRTRMLWLLLVAALGIVGAFAFVVTRSVLKPLAELRSKLDDIATGDEASRHARLDADRRDEFGDVAVSFNQFADQLVASSVEADANARVARARADEVSQAANVAAENMNTVAVATTELSAAAGEIARAAGDASRTAETAVQAADHANALMERLADSSARIGEVVESIRGIAAQTTMLALNATIEAARAGEAGRGFAVVASEVKDLASETGSATADIVNRVDAIRDDTQAALVALGEVAQVITDISSSQSVIAAAVEEQAATTAEIDRSLTEAVTAVNQLAGDGGTAHVPADGHFTTAA